MTSGPWGPDYSYHVIWHRGKSECPDGRFERISVLAWAHGGFSTKHESMDDFADALQANSGLAKEFRAAYNETLECVKSGTMRFRGDTAAKLALRLQAARQKVSSYKEEEIDLKKKYRATLRSQNMKKITLVASSGRA